MTIIEGFGVVFGVICIYLVIRQNIWCWPTGLVQVTLYVYIFYEVKLYSDLILHVVYIGMQFYGWYHWLNGGNDHEKLPVSKLSRSALTTWVVVSMTGTAAWGWFMASNTEASLPYGDAFTTVASLIAQWLMARKLLESWIFWIAVDIIAIGIYAAKSLYLTSGLYTLFLGMATYGFFKWKQSLGNPNMEKANG